MLARTHADPATLEAARAVGLTPGQLAARCVRVALRSAARRAASLFFGGALTPHDDGARAGLSSPARAGGTSLFVPGALTPRAESHR